jgi:hypothetical protein
MLPISHALFTYAAVPSEGAWLAILGSVLPDLPFLIGTPLVARGKADWWAAINASVESRIMGVVSRSAHSFVIWAAGAAAIALVRPELLPLMWGWLGHNVADLLTHHSEAHAHFYPLSDWKFESPVSYYEWEHHGRAYMIAETALALALIASWIRHEPLYATVEAVIAWRAVWVILAALLVWRWRAGWR